MPVGRPEQCRCRGRSHCGCATTSVYVTGSYCTYPSQGSGGSMEHPGNGDRWLGGPVLAIWACCGRMVIVDAVRVRRGSRADGMSAHAKLICTVGWQCHCASRPSSIACSCMVGTSPFPCIGRSIVWDVRMGHPRLLSGDGSRDKAQGYGCITCPGRLL